MLSKAEIEKRLQQTAETARDVRNKAENYRRAAGVSEPSEAQRPVNIVPTTLSPIRQDKR
jgi:hypothetical protein